MQWGDYLKELEGMRTGSSRSPNARQSYARGGSVKEKMKKLASEGRGGDTKLARIGPRTARMMDDVIHKGRTQRNPRTGLREYMMEGDDPYAAADDSGYDSGVLPFVNSGRSKIIPDDPAAGTCLPRTLMTLSKYHHIHGKPPMPLDEGQEIGEDSDTFLNRQYKKASPDEGITTAKQFKDIDSDTPRPKVPNLMRVAGFHPAVKYQSHSKTPLPTAGDIRGWIKEKGHPLFTVMKSLDFKAKDGRPLTHAAGLFGAEEKGGEHILHLSDNNYPEGMVKAGYDPKTGDIRAGTDKYNLNYILSATPSPYVRPIDILAKSEEEKGSSSGQKKRTRPTLAEKQKKERDLLRQAKKQAKERESSLACPHEVKSSASESDSDDPYFVPPYEGKLKVKKLKVK